jgi:hypothetical protein
MMSRFRSRCRRRWRRGNRIDGSGRRDVDGVATTTAGRREASEAGRRASSWIFGWRRRLVRRPRQRCDRRQLRRADDRRRRHRHRRPPATARNRSSTKNNSHINHLYVRIAIRTVAATLERVRRCCRRRWVVSCGVHKRAHQAGPFRRHKKSNLIGSGFASDSAFETVAMFAGLPLLLERVERLLSADLASDSGS